jgi:hypothetical protein
MNLCCLYFYQVMVLRKVFLHMAVYPCPFIPQMMRMPITDSTPSINGHVLPADLSQQPFDTHQNT